MENTIEKSNNKADDLEFGKNINYDGMNKVYKNKIVPYSNNSIMKFGKYKGTKIKDIAQNNFSYITWCMINIDKFYIYDDVCEFINKIAPISEVLQSKIINYEELESYEESVKEMEYIKAENKRMNDDGMREAFNLDDDWGGDMSDWMECNGY